MSTEDKKDIENHQGLQESIPKENNNDNINNNNMKEENNKNEDTNQKKEEEEIEELNKSNSDIEVNITTYTIKIVFVGDSNVGKTSIIQRFCEHKFEENIPATISAAFQKKKLKVDPFTEVNMNIWDTVGQEKYRSITRDYLRNSDGVFLVFDLHNKKSFDSLNYWLEELNNSDINKNCVKILIGNKSDYKEKEIDDETINKFSEENGLKYLAVSAKEGVNIESMFEIMGADCAKILQEKADENENNNQSEKNKEDERFIVKIEEKKINEDIKVIKKNACC